MILKSKHTSGLNKSTSVAAISCRTKDEVVKVLSENRALIVPRGQPAQRVLPSDLDSNIDANMSDINVRRKSDRRKSFTSSLMARSKVVLLEEHGGVMKQDSLPRIYDDCNHLEVAEYVDEIYHYYWITEVHLKFNLMQETLYLTITLLDSYLSLVTIKKKEMQLVGLTALLLASKYEDFWHPMVLDLINISAEAYTRDQMLGMAMASVFQEKAILKKLKFRLNAPTPYVFMLKFLRAAQSDTKLEHLAFYLVELCLVEYEALKFKPSLLCASAIYVARDCAEMVLKFHKVAKTTMLKVTFEKYQKLDYSVVASIKPLNELPLLS
ncbi:cyclin b3;1 [Actinidia rufa]|uniref:Cyclin b31 n=1 Tax=Actinidia rufa TaxID=165716 RepID=A0A7J0FL03_9ERIC|nr:cyclin b3;1 [Actinidia rufa]